MQEGGGEKATRGSWSGCGREPDTLTSPCPLAPPKLCPQGGTPKPAPLSSPSPAYCSNHKPCDPGLPPSLHSPCARSHSRNHLRLMDSPHLHCRLSRLAFPLASNWPLLLPLSLLLQPHLQSAVRDFLKLRGGSRRCDAQNLPSSLLNLQ